MTTEFVWPSDRARAENDELNRVCEVSCGDCGFSLQAEVDEDTVIEMWNLVRTESCADYEEYADTRAELAEIDSPQPAQQGSVPEGWRECLTEMVQAMHDYEMSVDEDAPYKHRAMMDRAHALLSATPQPQGDGCEWHSDDNGCWMSQCGKEWYFEDGGPEDNGMNYCVKCGKQCIEIGSSEDGGEGYDNAM